MDLQQESPSELSQPFAAVTEIVSSDASGDSYYMYVETYWTPYLSSHCQNGRAISTASHLFGGLDTCTRKQTYHEPDTGYTPSLMGNTIAMIKWP